MARHSGKILGTDSNDIQTGTDGRDVLIGSPGADTLDGGAGIDRLDYRHSSEGVQVDIGANTASGGDAEDDAISGFEKVRGSEYDDILIGSVERNTFQGGGGSDTFVFNTELGNGNVDKIKDFVTGEDKIGLDADVFGLDATTSFEGIFSANETGVAVDADDRLIYNTTTGELYYDADGTGEADAILFACLKPDLDLGADDFTIF